MKLMMLGDLIGGSSYFGSCPECGRQHISARDRVTAERVCASCANKPEGTKPVVKQIGYSYPSSPNAAKRGHGKMGCFTVDVLAADSVFAKQYTVSIHATKKEALFAAQALDLPWSSGYKRFHPEDVI